MKRHLILDGYNLIHRAKGGFQKGEWPIVFNFFRGLRPLIEKFLPVESVTFVIEGQPKRQESLLIDYKANRPASLESFLLQKKEVIDLLSSLPIDIVYHPDYEADDVVHNLILRKGKDRQTIVVSSDSDFTQLLQRNANGTNDVLVWNWRDDAYVTNPDFDYVTWKALRGDPTDNIPKCKGMSDKIALSVVNDRVAFESLLQNEDFKKDFERNKELIAFKDFDDATWTSCSTSVGTPDWNHVKEKFVSYGFKSMTKDSTWEKWVNTFKQIKSAH